MRVVFALLFAGLALHVCHAIFRFGGHTVDDLIKNVDYDVLLVGSAGACLARAYVTPVERRAWAILGAGLLVWACGDVSWSLFYEQLKNPPYPAPSDIGWLLFYPASYAALGLLVRARMPHFSRSLWLDGLVGALTVAALAAALVLPTLMTQNAGAAAAAVATNIAYPVFDIVLLGFVVIVFGLTGWRPDRVWLLLGLGMACSGIADSWYLYQVAAGTYAEGGLLDSFWPAATILMALAAWQPIATSRPIRMEGTRVMALPTAFALVALGIEMYDHFARVSHTAIVLSSAALLTVLVRLRLTFRENLATLARSRREATTDALTGLGNRRGLTADLQQALAEGEPRVLAIFDLDGFKSYNDAFGHPAGDALLARLGGNLAGVVGSAGGAYRMGGDEFCILVNAPAPGEGSLVDAAAESLCEQGRGFVVSASYGAVVLPREAHTTSEALQIGDQRLYRQKAGRRGSPRMQTRDVLLRVLEERQPDVRVQLREVADLSVAVGRLLGLSNEELDELARAAELNDVGKMAIPDAILDKAGPLDEGEWSFVRRHTLIGEAILSAAPALVPVARLVRSSHERFDGRGYPDGLAGDDIPLGSRIIFACDAFHAMTSERPHAPTRALEEAIAELIGCGGTQFDPRVVDVLCDVIRDRAEEARRESAVDASAPVRLDGPEPFPPVGLGGVAPRPY
jgi:diguanylate cyclase (GGDEF)-like protein